MFLPDIATLIQFTIAAFIVVLVPGVTVSAMVSTSLARGVAAGFWLEVGATLARLTMVIVVALALEAVTTLVAASFDIIKFAGAAYLVWIGIGYLTSRTSLAVKAEGQALTPWRQVLSGFLILWGNPKALIFFGAFLPLFVDKSHPAAPQVIILGLIEMGAAIIIDGGYIILASGARAALAGKNAVWLNRVAGAVLIAAALWLALQHQA